MYCIVLYYTILYCTILYAISSKCLPPIVVRMCGTECQQVVEELLYTDTATCLQTSYLAPQRANPLSSPARLPFFHLLIYLTITRHICCPVDRRPSIVDRRCLLRARRSPFSKQAASSLASLRFALRFASRFFSQKGPHRFFSLSRGPFLR